MVAAAERVGAGGSVLGLDFAQGMLDIAREKVDARALGNVELRVGDMTKPGIPPTSFDAVACVLGLFFVDDMSEVARSLWNLLRPGGRLAVLVLGDEFFSPMAGAFVEAMATVRPDVAVQQPWRRTEDPDVLRRVLADAGIANPRVTSHRDPLPLPSADDWWRIVVGTGLRRTVMELDQREADAVRSACARYVHDRDVREVVLSSHLALATKG